MANGRRLLVAMLGIGALGLFNACSSYDDKPAAGPDPADAVPANCSTIKGWSFVQGTLLPKCAGSACHDPGNERGVLVIVPSTAYAAMVNVPSVELSSMKLIEPESPSRSFVYRKLAGTQGAACQLAGRPIAQCGDSMPFHEWFALPEEWIEETRQWIACGAKP